MLQWYDREAKENVLERLPFSFLFLDKTATVVGYNKARKCGMYSNEVKDTRSQPFVVRWQDKALGMLCEGVWADIKDKVKASHGGYAVNVWVAFKDDDALKIGVVRMSGCALGPWIEFEQKHGNDMISKAVMMSEGKLDTSGSVDFTPPVFTLRDVSKETDDEAGVLQKQVQAYFVEYFKRPVAAHAAAPTAAGTEQEPAQPPEPGDDSPEPEDGDSVPF